MAEGALGISTGIGQGEAQIIKPFQSPVTAQQYGSVMAAQQKAKQDAAAKKAKAAASIADFQFKGLPQHAELFAKGYDDVVNYAIENIDDPLIEFKLKQRMSDLNTKANMSADLKTNLQKQADFVQQGQGKNYYLGFDEAVKEVVTPIDYTTFQDTNKFGQAIGGKANLLNGVKTVPIYDIGAAKSDLQNQISGWAKDNMQGKSWQADDKIINSFVEAELTGHPEAIVHFERVMKTDPIGAKAAGNDPYQYCFNELKKDLKSKGYTTGGNTNINIGGGDGGNKVTENVVTEQVRPIGVGGRNVKVRAFLYEKPVDLGARTQAERMFKIDTAGNTVSVEADAPPVSYNETIEAPVSTVDIEWTGRDGEKRTVKKGQIVDPDDAKAYAEFFTGKQIPTENALLSFGFDSDNNKYYEPAERIAPASIASFYGAKGATAKSEYIKKGVEKTPSTTGGTKTKSKKDVKLY